MFSGFVVRLRLEGFIHCSHGDSNGWVGTCIHIAYPLLSDV